MGGATYIKSLEINAGQFEEREGALQQQLVEVEAARQQDHSLIRQLKSELDNRSANSARLMAQLHKAKVQYKQYVDKVEDQGAAEGAYDDAFAVEDEDVEVGAGACGDSGEGSAFPSPPKASLNQLRMRRRASYVSPDRPQGAPGAPSSPHSSFRTSVRKAPAPSTGNTTGYTVVASTHRPPRQEEIQSTQAQLPVFPTPMPPIRRQGSSNSSLTRHMRRAVPTDSATP
jgi:hypothetical protein